MADVKVLIKGYLSKNMDGRTNSTSSLIIDNDIVMVIDPGMILADELKIALGNEGLLFEDINIIGLTHSHIDHYKNIGLFPNARILEYWGWWDGDVWSKCDGIISDDISMIKTPGHSYDSITFIIRTDKGFVAVCGDVFWKKDFPKKDAYATDRDALSKSRKNVLDVADYIIPGHDDMFSV